MAKFTFVNGGGMEYKSHLRDSIYNINPAECDAVSNNKNNGRNYIEIVLRDKILIKTFEYYHVSSKYLTKNALKHKPLSFMIYDVNWKQINGKICDNNSDKCIIHFKNYNKSIKSFYLVWTTNELNNDYTCFYRMRVFGNIDTN